MEIARARWVPLADLPELDAELMKSAGTGVPCSFAGEGEKCSVTVPPREPTAGVGETKRVPGLTDLGSGLWIMPSQPQFKSPHYLPPRGPKPLYPQAAIYLPLSQKLPQAYRQSVQPQLST